MSVGKYEDLMTVLVHRSGFPQHQHLQFERPVVRNVFCLVLRFRWLLSRRLSSTTASARTRTTASTRTRRVAHWSSGVGIGGCQSHVPLQGNTFARLSLSGPRPCCLWLLLCSSTHSQESLIKLWQMKETKRKMLSGGLSTDQAPVQEEERESG